MGHWNGMVRALGCVALGATLLAGCGDDDGPPVADDMGPVVGDSGDGRDSGPSTRCAEDSDCDDGVGCTADSCDERNCFNTPMDGMCEDDNPCTADMCSETDGCLNEVVADGTECTDAGGASGTCMAGVCSSGCTSDADCDDGVACTTNTCDTETGICSLELDDAACDDGAGCTVDVCSTSGCNNTMAADGTDCSTAGGATGTCMSGACVTGCASDAECDDGIDCTADVCDTAIGACSNTPEDSMCDDGVACTSDTCSAATGCTATPVNAACDDGIGCTSDVCDVSAGCMFTPVDMACDDSVDCTVDVCSPTTDCSRTPDDAMCDDMNSCTANSCDASGGCGATNVAGGTPCTDATGANGLCDGSGTCLVECTSNADCADTDLCNGMETCDTSSGTCVAGTPLSCDDGVSCTDDSCVPSTGCANVTNDANCDDGNPCTSGSCDATGDCSQSNVADTTACTVGGSTGQCQSGSCVIGCTSDTECDDGVACTVDSCDLTSGTCVNSPRNGRCDDGVACTVDRCQASGCVNETRDTLCDDGNDCTTNMCTASGCAATNVMDGATCDDASGSPGLCLGGTCNVECTEPTDCDDGNPCNGAETCSARGQCQAGAPLTCADMSACTTDSCDPATGCVFTPITCDDATSCTTNGCDPASGCVYTPVPTSCDDGNECTAEVCTSGGSGDGCTNPPVVDGTSCDGGAGTCQSGTCMTSNPVGYRLDQLRVVDPHAIIDTRVFGIVRVCGDITNNDLTVVGNTIPNLNGALNELVTMDGDGDTFADFGYVLYFDDLDQGAGATGTMRAVESNCTLPDPSDCAPVAMGQDVSASYVVRRTGSCTPAAVAFADTTAWPDGETSSMEVNRPTAGGNGCFESSAIPFDLDIELQGTPVTIPLQDTVIAAQFADMTGDRLTNGVLVGFLTETDADIDITVDVTASLSITVNLGDDVLPDNSHCQGHDGRDTWAGPDGMMGTADDETGWWFMVNLTGRGAATLTGY